MCDDDGTHTQQRARHRRGAVPSSLLALTTIASPIMSMNSAYFHVPSERRTQITSPLPGTARPVNTAQLSRSQQGHKHDKAEAQSGGRGVCHRPSGASAARRERRAGTRGRDRDAA